MAVEQRYQGNIPKDLASLLPPPVFLIVQKWQLARELSGPELAERADLETDRMEYYGSRPRIVPKCEDVHKIAKALDVAPGVLYLRISPKTIMTLQIRTALDQASDQYPDIRSTISTWKDHLGVSVAALAFRSGLKGHILYYVLSDRSPEPTDIILTRIADGIGISALDLLRGRMP